MLFAQNDGIDYVIALRLLVHAVMQQRIFGIACDGFFGQTEVKVDDGVKCGEIDDLKLNPVVVIIFSVAVRSLSNFPLPFH